MIFPFHLTVSNELLEILDCLGFLIDIFGLLFNDLDFLFHFYL